MSLEEKNTEININRNEYQYFPQILLVQHLCLFFCVENLSPT